MSELVLESAKLKSRVIVTVEGEPEVIRKLERRLSLIERDFFDVYQKELEDIAGKSSYKDHVVMVMKDCLEGAFCHNMAELILRYGYCFCVRVDEFNLDEKGWFAVKASLTLKHTDTGFLYGR